MAQRCSTSMRYFLQIYSSARSLNSTIYGSSARMVFVAHTSVVVILCSGSPLVRITSNIFMLSLPWLIHAIYSVQLMSSNTSFHRSRSTLFLSILSNNKSKSLTSLPTLGGSSNTVYLPFSPAMMQAAAARPISSLSRCRWIVSICG